MELARNLNGDLVIPGSVKKVYTVPFINESGLPSWLTDTSAGGSSVAVSKSDGGYMSMTSNGGLSQVKLSTPLEIQYYSAMRWDLEGVYFGHASNPLNLYASFTGSSVGAYAQFGEPTAIRKSGGTPDYIEQDVTDRYQERQNLSFLLLTKRKAGYVLENDQVMGCIPMPTMVNTGSITPDIAYKSNPSTTSTARISQIRLTLWMN